MKDLSNSKCKEIAKKRAKENLLPYINNWKRYKVVNRRWSKNRQTLKANKSKEKLEEGIILTEHFLSTSINPHKKIVVKETKNRKISNIGTITDLSTKSTTALK